MLLVLWGKVNGFLLYATLSAFGRWLARDTVHYGVASRLDGAYTHRFLRTTPPAFGGVARQGLVANLSLWDKL